jgi:ABC-2 type transport system permease protein
MTPAAELTRYSELLRQLTQRELKGKYKRSTLGWAWSLVNPLAQMGMFVLVFGVFFDAEVPIGDPSGLEVFALFLVCGLLPWNFLANGLTQGSGTLVANANLVRKVWFPRELLVLAVALAGSVTFLIELGVLTIALLLVGNMVLPVLPAVALLVVTQLVFVVGLALLLSAVNVYFRDLEHLIGVLLQLWFYATPIIYPISLVQSSGAFADRPWLLDVYRLNPMVRFVEAYRDLLYDLRAPTAGTIAYLVTVAVGALLLGRWTFGRLEGRLAEEL